MKYKFITHKTFYLRLKFPYSANNKLKFKARRDELL